MAFWKHEIERMKFIHNIICSRGVQKWFPLSTPVKATTSHLAAFSRVFNDEKSVFKNKRNGSSIQWLEEDSN